MHDFYFNLILRTIFAKFWFLKGQSLLVRVQHHNIVISQKSIAKKNFAMLPYCDVEL